MQDQPFATGYVDDVAYPTTCFPELSPAWLCYVAASHSVAPPDPTLPFRYLELGCGAGKSTVTHAAAFPHAEFHACDRDPAALARGAALASDRRVRNLRFHCQPFSALDIDTLPAMDFIVLHGVYSWVNSGERQAIRRILGRLLKPGGLVYLSYNCLPGWSSELPLRRLLAELAASQPGDSATRIGGALKRLAALASDRWRYLRQTPAAAAAIASYRRADPAYLAHEFLNADWESLYAVDLHDQLEAADLQFVGSATLADNHPALIMDADTGQRIASLPSRRLRIVAEDFALNRQFRRDVFVRASGARHDPDAWRSVWIAPAQPGSPMPGQVRVPVGDIRFDPDFVGAVAALLPSTGTTLGSAVAALSRPGHDPAAVRRNLQYLMAGNVLAPATAVQPGGGPAFHHHGSGSGRSTG